MFGWCKRLPNEYCARIWQKCSKKHGFWVVQKTCFWEFSGDLSFHKRSCDGSKQRKQLLKSRGTFHQFITCCKNHLETIWGKILEFSQLHFSHFQKSLRNEVKYAWFRLNYGQNFQNVHQIVNYNGFWTSFRFWNTLDTFGTRNHAQKCSHVASFQQIGNPRVVLWGSRDPPWI